MQTERHRHNNPDRQPRVLDLPDQQKQQQMIAYPGNKKRQPEKPITPPLRIEAPHRQNESRNLQRQEQAEPQGEMGGQGPGQDS